jgi:multidrug efflux pump subunit AcrA (membrane-fusion protein)
LDVETQGRISLIGSKIDKSNRTFKIEVKVGRVAKNLKPNMLTEITLNISTVKDVITIPINIVQQEINGNKYLMVVDRNNGTLVARKVYITTGETNDREAIVTQGLSPGDEVILIGGRTVTEGSPLEILDNSVLSLDSNLGGQ